MKTLKAKILYLKESKSKPNTRLAYSSSSVIDIRMAFIRACGVADQTFRVRLLMPSISNQPVQHLVINVLVEAAKGEDSFSNDYAVTLAAPHCQRNLPN